MNDDEKKEYVITVPEPQLMTVQVQNENETKLERQAVDWKTVAVQLWLQHPALGQSIQLLSARKSITEKIQAGNGTVKLWGNELSVLKQVAAQPAQPYPLDAADAMLRFYEALENAVDAETYSDLEPVPDTERTRVKLNADINNALNNVTRHFIDELPNPMANVDRSADVTRSYVGFDGSQKDEDE